MSDWGGLVTAAREAAGMKRYELAEAIGVDASLISKIEGNKVYIEAPIFMKLTNALRTLKPWELANALGYQVTVRGADRLPRGLTVDLLSLSDDELEAIALLAQRKVGRAHPPEPPDYQ